MEQSSLLLAKTEKMEGTPFVMGYAKGIALVIKPLFEYEIQASDAPLLEQKKFRRAIEVLEKEFSKALKNKISREQKSLLEASKMLLMDRGWNQKIEGFILKGVTAKTAICQMTEEISKKMAYLNDAYLRERMHDFQDLAGRLIRILENFDSKNKKVLLPNSIILVAQNLGPAQLMEYDLSKIKGILLVEGSQTMHLSIVARAYGIPLIGGVSDALKCVISGNELALDAVKGVAYKNPSDEILNELETAQKNVKKQEAIELKNKDKPSFTKDGKRIELGINLGLVDDILLANAPPFDKVGLYRTELPFMLAKELPNCEEQTLIYKKVLMHAKGKPVIFRTLDIGSDKVLPYMHHQKEENPAMGWRSTRITLDRRALLRMQLRALIRASEGTPLYLMFPMIGEVGEFLLAKQTLELELRAAEQRHETLPAQVYVGSMLEIPSLFYYFKNDLQLFDFISIGTNDLKQFFFASDRGNKVVSNRYDSLSPAFLSYLKQVRETCSKAHIPCSVCGEMAGFPLEAMALIGIGFTSLSMNPYSLLAVKTALRELNQSELSDYITRLIETESTSIRIPLMAYLRDHHVLGD